MCRHGLCIYFYPRTECGYIDVTGGWIICKKIVKMMFFNIIDVDISYTDCLNMLYIHIQGGSNMTGTDCV